MAANTTTQGAQKEATRALSGKGAAILSEDFVEMSDELEQQLSDADKRIDELSDQLRAAQHQKQQLLDEVVARIAEFSVGQTVLCYERKYRITKVSGEVFGIMGQRPKVWLRYHGERVKADGSLMGREKRLYDIQPIPTQE